MIVKLSMAVLLLFGFVCCIHMYYVMVENEEKNGQIGTGAMILYLWIILILQVLGGFWN